MVPWNVVVTVNAGRYRQAQALLRAFGQVHKTEYYNVLALSVDDVTAFLDDLARELAADPAAAQSIARVVPVTATFVFQTPEEFEQRATAAVEPWLAQLAGHGFHVRMHRRGFKGRLSSQHEERFLDHFIVEHTGKGHPARVDFDDPDYIVAVETLGQEAGLSLWDRAARARWPLLGLD